MRDLTVFSYDGPCRTAAGGTRRYRTTDFRRACRWSAAGRKVQETRFFETGFWYTPREQFTEIPPTAAQVAWEEECRRKWIGLLQEEARAEGG